MIKPIAAITLQESPFLIEAIRQLHKAQDSLRRKIVRNKKNVNAQVLLTQKVDKLQRIIDLLDDFLSQ